MGFQLAKVFRSCVTPWRPLPDVSEAAEGDLTAVWPSGLTEATEGDVVAV